MADKLLMKNTKYKLMKSKSSCNYWLQLLAFTSLTFVTCYLTLVYFFNYTERLGGPEWSEEKKEYLINREDNAKLWDPLPPNPEPTNAPLPNPPLPTQDKCDVIEDNERFDCFPKGNSDPASCGQRGCCWSMPKQNTTKSVPYCYYPKDFALYQYLNLSVADYGATIFFKAVYSSPYPNDVQLLRMDIKYETLSRLHVKIYDPVKKRFEPPYPEVPLIKSVVEKEALYQVDVDRNRVGFRVIRKSNNKKVFESLNAGALTFADQFLQLSAWLPTSHIYGLGQHRSDFVLNTDWGLYTFFNRDQPPEFQKNLYGSHPFLMTVDESGNSLGVLLLNSNAMDIILQPSPAVTYRTIGGVLDFYFFLGPTPTDVVDQYTELVGRPFIPPYWSLGFHLCRWGYNTLDNTKAVLERNQALGIPLDVQWNDIDYMDKQNDFTYDRVNFKGLGEFVQDLHKRGLHYVMIMDPGISGGEPHGTYPPYDDAIKLDILVKDHTGKAPLVGKVWNIKSTVFPDFTNPKTVGYWISQISRQQKEQFEYDGMWIDMNEPSNFLNGSVDGCPEDSPLENPPYVPSVVGGKLKTNTLCMTAQHHKGNHYDIHNVYGMSEAVVTNFALKEVTKKRPFVISRSSFVGQGRFSGTWTGDNSATWEDMHQSIADILSMNMFGIPMVGADICGFQTNTTAALCQRWHQLGAFYPFSRNHNSHDSNPQDPAFFGPEVVASTRKALLIRYTILPYLYSLFFEAHSKGGTVARPLFFEFPSDKTLRENSNQFLLGPAFLVIPVLTEGMTYVSVYLPKCRWFDYYTRKEIVNKGDNITFPAPLDTIPLALRGGFILPTQRANVTTTLSRLNKMDLIVVPNEEGVANGSLYWDDGESIEPYERNEYNHLQFVLNGKKLASSVVVLGYGGEQRVLGGLDVLGVAHSPTSVSVNGTSHTNFSYQADSKNLLIKDLALNMSKPFEISWD